jgi:hypothetical protein
MNSFQKSSFSPSGESDSRIFKLIQKAWTLDLDDYRKLVFQKSVSEPKNHFLLVSIVSYLQISSYLSSQISSQAAYKTLHSNQSSSSLKVFALQALSNSYFSTNFQIDSSFLKPEYHSAVLRNAIKAYDESTINLILSQSLDFSLIFLLQSRILFIDHEVLRTFLQNSLQNASGDELIDATFLFIQPV